MKDPRLAEAKKADSWQSAKALLIPFSLFLACVVSAAGTFLIYHEEPLGWAFLLVGGATIVAAFVGLIRFQNQFRARGIVVDAAQDESEASGLEEKEYLETGSRRL
jgi:hypothetical protein